MSHPLTSEIRPPDARPLAHICRLFARAKTEVTRAFTWRLIPKPFHSLFSIVAVIAPSAKGRTRDA